LFNLIKLLAQLLHLVTISHQPSAISTIHPCEIFTVTPRPVSNPALANQLPLRCRLGSGGSLGLAVGVGETESVESEKMIFLEMMNLRLTLYLASI